MSYYAQGRLFTFEDFCDEHDDNTRLVMVLSALEPHLSPLVWKLERERIGRRNRYPVDVMMKSLVAGWVYQIPVKNELIRELRRNGSLRRLVGIESMAKVPQAWQFSRVHLQAGRGCEPWAVGSCFRALRGEVEETITWTGPQPGNRRNIGRKLVERYQRREDWVTK